MNREYAYIWKCTHEAATSTWVDCLTKLVLVEILHRTTADSPPPLTVTPSYTDNLSKVEIDTHYLGTNSVSEEE